MEILNRIESRQFSVGIIGLGYVGLPLALAFCEAGFSVVGVDVAQEKVQKLARGESYIEDVPDEQVKMMVKNGRFTATTDYKMLKDVDAISICVPTPLTKTKDPDISYIIHATENIAQTGVEGKLVVLESTTYPGTTDEIILPRLAKNGKKVGQDFYLAFSPERIDPGRTDFTIYTTPKVIGGVTDRCLQLALKLYGTIVEQPVPVSSTGAAEMVKILENTFRAVNIGLVNEVALMCDKLGLNVWEVVEAAKTKPYGFMPFYPGPGLGGHCIPVDPHYLSWKLKTLNYTARFIELATEVNGFMPNHVINKVMLALNANKKAINGSRILVVGVAYKPNVGDVRESPALDIIKGLCDYGADVHYHDPFVETLKYEGICLDSISLTDEVVSWSDCVVIVTNHDSYDWDWLSNTAKVIVDTRNAIKKPGKGYLVKL
ncbi:MAG: nucleotide sugar dehydrogenase [Chloroflexota bacterium]